MDNLFAELQTQVFTLMASVRELEKFRDFAQPHVIRASDLWDKIHGREGLKDHFKPIRVEAPPLVQLADALDKISPVEATPEIGESKPTMEGAD